MSESQQAITAIRLTGPLDALLRHRSLTWELARRDILGRYRGASFGLLWSLISPFLMLIIYTLAFGYILKSRWPGASGNIADFAMLLFVGLIVHGFFAECLTRAPTLITGNTNLVKRIVFPLQVLPWTMVLSALFHAFTNTIVFLVLNLVVRGELHATVLFLPFVYAPLAIGLLGVGWLLSSLSVFLRDITQITGVLATAMLFLSSAIVPVETLPSKYQFVFMLNPLTFIINEARDVAFWGRQPDWIGLATYTVGATIFAFMGYAVFQKTRRGFADVL
ncbi:MULTISPECIES: ABC transporter permease [Stenotrophomonas]|uniref:ABC transporter permease n=1 Tax=Stenotrophomonas TaxID=40323 RepID=UPI000DAAA4A4|nr:MULTISPECIES: ABC transporter permease [Stenotrophomonas]AYA89410.1 sugar ABC transporter permease [Stenotrophomonas sp. Pemsol]MCU1004889.1 ABC transporter permease [Stenotrophomonas maltophilia]PZS95993.1 sugar ABC transporter permease [Stenotrophomonas maltophilia]PZT25015.1 sugar ABC transporter permease [Stenotrophomonas maltophilia]PZT40810.1 sugar ABC transporter permease [Stenotrophomonas maltophilia]